MAQQSSRELASTNPTTGAQDAGVQECGVGPTISVLPCCHLRHLQRPAPPDLSQDAPSVPSLCHADVARGHRRRVTRLSARVVASIVRQRDNARTPLPDASALERALRRNPAGAQTSASACATYESRG